MKTRRAAPPSAAIETGVAGMSNDEKDEEMICALTADEHSALRRRLNELPETMPPRDVWQRIRSQAEAEGLVRHPSRGRIWYAGVGVAAAAIMAAIILPGLQDDGGITVPACPVNKTQTACLSPTWLLCGPSQNNSRAICGQSLPVLVLRKRALWRRLRSLKTVSPRSITD